MCLWKMTPSVNRKFAFFAIFFEKSVIAIFNILILFIFIVFMQKLPQSCTAGFSVVVFWMSGPTASGRSRRARRSARQAWCRRGRAALNDRRLSAEAERRAHLPEKAFCLSRASPDPRGSVGVSSGTGASIFVHGDSGGRSGLSAEDARLPAGARHEEKKSCPRRP